jgi:squalene synthase HpnC
MIARERHAVNRAVLWASPGLTATIAPYRPCGTSAQMAFAEELKRYGPGAPYSVTLTEARAYCARLAATHYENFSVVTWLTPRALRPHLESVYAFCRWADDLGDEVGDRGRSRELLAWWRAEVSSLYAGRARHPVMVALGETVAAFDIPSGPFEDLISAFEQDQEVTDYQTFAELLDYCRRSANPVGRLVLYLGRCCTLDNVALADATCTGLQLANFWQDVARDLDIGRVYLPREDRERFGCTGAGLEAKLFSPEFAAMLEFECARAREFLLRGRPLVDRVPRELRLAVDLFGRGGLAILDRIEQQAFNVLARRPRLDKLAKVGLVLRSLVASSRARTPVEPSIPGLGRAQ